MSYFSRTNMFGQCDFGGTPFGPGGSGGGAPAVPTLTAPANGVTLLIGASVTVSATSTDLDLTRMEWVLDPSGSATIVATDSTMPYSTSWLIAQSAGAHTLVARAVRGAQTTNSTTINITLRQLATPVLTAPANGATLFVGEAVTVSATSTDVDLDRIDWVLDSGGVEVVVATGSSSPYSQTWTVAQTIGAHTLVARAIKDGVAVDSASISITLVNPTQITDTFFSGSGTFTTPANFLSTTLIRNQLFPQCWAGGGGGTTNTGSGGGGGFSGNDTYAAAPSTGYAYSVAAASAATANGADTTFDTTGVVAKGGTNAAGGSLGGTAAAGTGTIKFSGGNGVVGTGTRVGGAGAGNKASAVTSTGGADTGMSGSSANGFPIGGGGASLAGSSTGGRRGEFRVAYCIPATAGFPYQPRPPTTGRDAADATTRNITLPLGTGGRLLVYVSSDVAPTITMDAAWTKLAQLSDGTNVTTSAWFTIDATAGDPSNLTITTSSSEQVVWQCERWRGAGVPEIATATGSSTNPNPPSVTYSGGSAKIVWKVTVGMDTNGGPDLTAAPTNFISAITLNGTGTGGASPLQTVAERYLEIATLDPPTFTCTAEQWVCATIAIPPG